MKKRKEPVFNKSQLLSVSDRPEVLDVVLDQEKQYTKKESERLAKKFLERKI